MSASEQEASGGVKPGGGAAQARRDPAAGLEPFRRRLDLLDGEIAARLGERFAVCREIALYKREHEIPMMQPERVEQVRARYLDRGGQARLPADFIAALFELVIDATCRMEDDLIGAEDPGGPP